MNKKEEQKKDNQKTTKTSSQHEREIKKQGLDDRNERIILVGLFILLLLVGIYFAYVNFGSASLSNNNKINKIKVKIIKIEAKCDDCFNLDILINDLAKQNIEFEEIKVDYDTQEAEQLIKDYNIQKVPALIIVSNQLDKVKLNENLFRIQENGAVFEKGVPYRDIASEKIKGFVKIKEIFESSCKECISFSSLQKTFEGMGVKIENYSRIEKDSSEAKKLIQQNNISFVPVFLVSKDIEEYWWIFDRIKPALTETQDYYVLKNPMAPYIDLSTNKIRGKVDAIYLVDENCSDCFNATILKGLFLRSGIYFDNEEFIDINSKKGKILIKKYNITAIPTIIFSKEISDYPALESSLKNIGTFESDGKFVFRKVGLLNLKYEKLNETSADSSE